MEAIFQNLDIPSLIPELYIKTKPTYYLLRCPVCGKKEAYMPIKNGIIKPYIACNRKNRCGIVISLFEYLKTFHNLSKKETFSLLKNNAGIKEDINYNDFICVNINYTGYNPHIFNNYSLNELILNFNKISLRDKFIAIITFIYNFSLKTDQSKKFTYYSSRGINAPSNIGFLSKEDIKLLSQKLLNTFPLKYLYYFRLFRDKYFKFNSDFSVIPSFDYYSNLITAIRLRNIYPSSFKEIEISFSRIAKPLPYPLNRTLLKENIFFFTEGHIDALSLNLKTAIAIEGVNSINKDLLELFKNKKIYLLFDEDKAGRAAKTRFKSKNIIPIYWNKKLGKDINELLLNNNLEFIYKSLNFS